MTNNKTVRYASVAIASSLFGLGLAGNAYADAYAVSYDNIYNLVFTNTATITVSSSTPSSTTGISLNGSNASSGGNNNTDALATSLGTVTRTNNLFNFFGPSGGSYSNADAWIPTEQFTSSGGLTGNATQSINVAENDLSAVGVADGTAQNSSVTGFTVTFFVTSPGTVSFSGDAVPYMLDILTADLGIGSSATSQLSASIDITDASGTSFLHFAPTALNLTQGGAFPNENKTYDPTGCGTTIGAGTTCATPLTFSGTSLLLPDGQYTLTLRAVESADTIRTAVVPEPATLALLGLGLMGIGFARRRTGR